MDILGNKFLVVHLEDVLGGDWRYCCLEPGEDELSIPEMPAKNGRAEAP